LMRGRNDEEGKGDGKKGEIDIRPGGSAEADASLAMTSCSAKSCVLYVPDIKYSG